MPTAIKRSGTQLTTAELVDFLSAIARDPQMISERLRHWARMRLLDPVGGRHPGTGFHRRYAEGAIVRAAVLNVLADMGYKITSLEQSLRTALDQTENARRRWKPGHWAFLTVALRRSSAVLNAPWEVASATYQTGAGPNPPTLNQMVHRGFLGVCVIDLGQIFQFIEDKGGKS